MVDQPYKSVLGVLLYITTRTHPDISTALSTLGKFQAEPRPLHWKKLQHVLRYIAHATNFELLLHVTPGDTTLKA